MSGSMVDIQSPTAEIRRGRKKERKKKKIEITAAKYNGLPTTMGSHNKRAATSRFGTLLQCDCISQLKTIDTNRWHTTTLQTDCPNCTTRYYSANNQSISQSTNVYSALNVLLTMHYIHHITLPSHSTTNIWQKTLTTTEENSHTGTSQLHLAVAHLFTGLNRCG